MAGLKHDTVGTQLTQTEWEAADSHSIEDLIPDADDTYDLGSAAAAWQDLYLEGDITMTDAGTIATSAGALTITSAAAATWSTSAGALTLTSAAAATWSTGAGALTITSAAAATWSTSAGALTIDGDDGITLQTTGSGNVTISEILDITDSTDSSDASGDTGALRTEGGASIAKKLYVGTDLDVDGTANLDAVDVDGAVQIDNTITVGANDQGYDIIFYGDTASANLTWDTSEDDLILNGATRIVVPDGQLVLGSTAVSSTAAELNLLDGVSGLVQADLTKLAAIDATSTEINLIDGGTARGTNAVGTGDGILINDGGTMRMINVDTVSTYFASHSVGGTSIVTVGTIATGVWNGTALVDAYVADALTISGGTVNNSVIGGSTAAAITGTTIDATTDFTIGDTVITDGVITDTSGLSIAAAVAIADDKSITLGEAGKIDFGDTAPDDDEATGIIFSFTAGTTLAIGDVVFMHSDGEVAKANSGAITTMPAIGICVGAGTDGNPVDVMVQGVMHDTSAFATLAIGADLFVTGAGVFDDAAPSSGGDTVQKIGVAIHADKAYFNFNTTEILLA